jgi:hypothetical protein
MPGPISRTPAFIARDDKAYRDFWPETSFATLHATPPQVGWYGCCEALLGKDAGCVTPQ